jgi:hypothetical protein
MAHFPVRLAVLEAAALRDLDPPVEVWAHKDLSPE